MVVYKGAQNYKRSRSIDREHWHPLRHFRTKIVGKELAKAKSFCRSSRQSQRTLLSQYESRDTHSSTLCIGMIRQLTKEHLTEDQHFYNQSICQFSQTPSPSLNNVLDVAKIEFRRWRFWKSI
ncbi:MAG: hypothetical protein IPQ18_10760 [Saprospiraceae bacterium]|nr:hypothetical protein [Saprospiraceae bacterium]